MEIIILIIFSILILIAIASIVKYYMLKKDIFNYTSRLENNISNMLKGIPLDPPVPEKDDLLGKINEKLFRLSSLYTQKNMELVHERSRIEELISDISHQTKTPMTNIKYYLEAIETNDHFDSIHNYLPKMNNQINKLNFLMQSMTMMSQLETDSIKIQKHLTLISDTLAAAISQIMVHAEKKKITIHVECDEKTVVNHDKKWTVEAIFNILDNAVKYTQSGGLIKITVSQQILFTAISIQDNGKGIAQERQGSVFVRFYREPEIHNDEGIGIGLYLARKIITLQNGYIELKSKPGLGSNCTVYLPNEH